MKKDREMNRVFNFNPGPSTLPLEALEEAAKELVNYQDSGMSIMEHSHRGKEYEAVHNGAIASIRDLYQIPENYDVLFIQGGASLQFAMIPMCFLREGKKALYVNSGTWATKAIKEVKIQGKKYEVIATSEDTNFDQIPLVPEINNAGDIDYVYITSNNTIFGTEYKKFPETNGVPLIIDASSDVFSAPVDWKNIGVLFAGAQKNAGPAGVVIAIVRKDLYERETANIPTMLRYSTYATNNSLYNTPPTLSIYIVHLVMKWLKETVGGLEAMKKRNEEKAALVYDAIDSSNGFYKGHAQKNSRSLMNITFTLANKDLDAKFLEEAKAIGLYGLKGHRSVGGMRASTYNAMPVEGCKRLAEFMKTFAAANR